MTSAVEGSVQVNKPRIKYSKTELLALKDAPLSKLKPSLPVAELYLSDQSNASAGEHHQKTSQRGRGSTRGAPSTRGKVHGKPDSRNKNSWQSAEVSKTHTDLESELSQEEAARRKEFEEFRKQHNNYKNEVPAPTTKPPATTTTAPTTFVNITDIPSEEDLLAQDFLAMEDVIGSYEEAKPVGSSRLLKFFQSEKPKEEPPVHPLLQMLQHQEIPQQQPQQPLPPQQKKPSNNKPMNNVVFKDVDALEAELLKQVPISQQVNPSVHMSFDANAFFKQYQQQTPVPVPTMMPQHHIGHALSYAQATSTQSNAIPIPNNNKKQQQPKVQQVVDNSSPKQKKRLVPAQTIKATTVANKQSLHVDQLFAAVPQNYQPTLPATSSKHIMSIEDVEKELFANAK